VGPLGESGDNWLERLGSGYMTSWHLQGCSPRLCRLRNVRLVPASKYWTYRPHVSDMDPISIVVGCQQKVDFSPLLHWLLWERSWVRTRGSHDRRALYCVGSLSSWMQWICSNMLMTMKGCYMWTAWDMYGHKPYADWAWKACDMLIGPSPAGCTSIRIAATLGYE
jgi:hypothetical protein